LEHGRDDGYRDGCSYEDEQSFSKDVKPGHSKHREQGNSRITSSEKKMEEGPTSELTISKYDSKEHVYG
jgi:hypothetical protein